MSPSYSQAEIDFLLAWAREDHLGLVNGPARSLQRQHGVPAAVLGQLLARLSTVTGRTQVEMVEGPAPATTVAWPWPGRAAWQARVKELLPASTVQYLEELGAFPADPIPA
jgi:hypothetical protein